MSGTDDFLNSLARGTKPTETEFTHHPPGKFHGQVTSIRQETAANGKPIYKVRCETTDDSGKDVGVCDVPFWCWSSADQSAAMRGDEKARESIVRTIATFKKLLVDVGLFSKEQAESMPWSSDADETDVLSSIGLCVGRKCQIVVKPNPRDATKMQVFLNPAVGKNYDTSSAVESAYSNGGGSSYQKSGGEPTLPGMDTADADIPF